jgi:glyoxylase-like metal-dependent hydrolase (beta-lactamase superfamily II)
MKIECLVLGSYQTNSYIVRVDESSRDCLVIDTGMEPGGASDFLLENKLEPLAAVFTHGHIDHIGDLVLLRKHFGRIKVYIHRLDGDKLTGDPSNMAVASGIRFITDPAEVLVEDGDVVEEAGISLKVLHTPGHTPGGISLHCESEGILFSGDTLFAESVGRTDFPGGSTTELIESIRSKLLNFSDDTIVYPGHGPSTTIGHEKKNNPFL